ncbi:DNA polymerase [Streptomyces cacaoi]|uniref:DNA polymerase I n=1 Tax=Streptomyces cacaoi TaxID=1898 RepID=A0A4Y3QYB0_STRCI|nr:DNA polymerase [Streptomyces cacaoi]GEB50394.1 hypothetical protein SCA03_29450 [Streptomyces cacaoi]
MLSFCYRIGTEPITINAVEHEEDLPAFRTFIRRNKTILGFDTETTGLKIYQPGFRVRLAQFGNANEAWVIPLEHGGQMIGDVLGALRHIDRLVMHNGTFDILSLDQWSGDIRAEELFPKLLDSKITAHLVDSRSKKDGGHGHTLEELTKVYIDDRVATEVKGSMAHIAQRYRTTKEKAFSQVDLFDPELLLYAGMDPLLAYRLAHTTLRKIPHSARGLIGYEHQLAAICGYMQRTGYLTDRDYCMRESAALAQQAAHWQNVARRCAGVENVNSTDQVAAALIARGHRLTHKTKTGKWQVNDNILKSCAPDPLAEAVINAKKYAKMKSTWFDNFILASEGDGRCHGSINSLGARTARMSISGDVPAQTLPSKDPYVRNAFIADEGHVTVAVDYAAQELRVAAALSGDRRMKQAFAEGADLHQITADAAGVDRAIGKMTNFLSAYGGGASALMEQGGLDEPTAKHVITKFWQAWPGLARYNRQLMDEARRRGRITTMTGRQILVDKDRPYSAMNYKIQSSSRDVTGRALLRLHKEGFTPYARLPVHDECVFSMPAEHAEYGARRAAQIMREEIRGVVIDTEPTVAGRSWGSKYEKECAA